MRKLICLICLFSAFCFAGFQLDSFQVYVDSVVPGSRYGLSIRSVKTGAEWGNIRGKEKFTPASTLKTLTTATAIHYLPLDYAPKTEVSLSGSLRHTRFVGTIHVRGGGDPNFSGRYYADPFYMLYAMADSIHALGIDSVSGMIRLDSSYYKGPWRAEHWRKNFYDAWYGAEIAPLGFNDNCTMIRFKPGEKVGDTARAEILPDVGYVVLKNEMLTVPGKKRKWTWALDSAKPEITIGGAIGINVDSSQLVLPVRNPIAYFKAAFVYALKERGIAFIEQENVPQGIQIKSFTYSAAPFLSFLDEINQRSQNMHAETLFRNLGAQKMGEGSVEGGRAAEMKFLREIGIDTADFEIWDGCGLSPKNKVKPSTETALLAKMARHPKGKYYINSFAGPGLGTGGKRMLDLPYPWLTRFKTGFIGEVHGLVGYIYTLDGDTLAVAMYLNETGRNPDATLKDVLDTLWTRLVYKTNDHYASLMKMKRMWLSAQNVAGLTARLEYFSRIMKGTPYKLGPMGESYLDSIENKPLVYMDSVDCVTYLEHALAMAISPNENEIFNTLQKIRYRGGNIGYVNRKHYLLADWVGEGTFARPMKIQGDTVVFRTMPKQSFFKAKKIKYESPDAPMELRYLPYDRAVEMASRPYEGPLMVTGVAFVANMDNLDATHTGFVVFRNGEKPLLRHAAYKKQVLELPLVDYLKSRSKAKLPGITLFEFLKP
ncbi:D-alanyl-D-alanine carboxypeptidase/D-alanyl-D-alanine-endopeptidase [uncultured Fibrobacter sp.]|uniref:D-alanyl-D-alanine carboxypeptidase/D-alanyl-D-alanine endopeptidase n=1 Tax=uncultured Fibrobacter sp. TaxID=261512 RepID=UPI002637BDC9|nr:D-alanyl-D-alanine carboxypeptidase/D-alanyl-D-alanine-endopeptidase [uncultured Fibrobacter sp.]